MLVWSMVSVLYLPMSPGNLIWDIKAFNFRSNVTQCQDAITLLCCITFGVELYDYWFRNNSDWIPKENYEWTPKYIQFKHGSNCLYISWHISTLHHHTCLFRSGKVAQWLKCMLVTPTARVRYNVCNQFVKYLPDMAWKVLKKKNHTLTHSEKMNNQFLEDTLTMWFQSVGKRSTGKRGPFYCTFNEE